MTQYPPLWPFNRAKYGQKMDKKCHFMAKNASNDPKFGLEVYLDGFY